jgi:outer membrane protein assembly factor BamB
MNRRTIIGVIRTLSLALSVLAGVAVLDRVTLSADNWPRFRGDAAGVAPDDALLPETWNAKDNVAWKVRVPGYAWSSPIVWDHYVFVTSVLSSETGPAGPGLVEPREDKATLYHGPPTQKGIPQEQHRWMLYAFDCATGKMLWSRELQRGLPRYSKHPQNSYASETPVTDGTRVFVYTDLALYAVDFKGRLLWSRDVPLPEIPPGTFTAASAEIAKSMDREPVQGAILDEGDGLGAASSPSIHRGRLFIVADYNARQWLIAAFDTKDGKELWRIHDVKKVQNNGWATPFVWVNAVREELITIADRRVRSFDLDGHPLWQLSPLTLSNTPSPFAANGLLYVNSGWRGDQNRPIYAIRPGGSGDISLSPSANSSDQVAWVQRQAGSHLTSNLVYGGYLYTLHDQGILTCHDAQTGALLFRTRLSPQGGFFTASPWAYNGKIFAINEEGDTFVIQVGPQYKLLGENSLGEMVYATPAVAHHSLIIRTKTSLYRLTKSPELVHTDRIPSKSR